MEVLFTDYVEKEDFTEQVEIPHTSSSTPTFRSLTPKPITSKRTSRKVTTYAQEYHKKRMEMMETEHNFRMTVLREELQFWKNKNKNLIESKTPNTVSPQRALSSEIETFTLLTKSMQP